MTTTGTQTGTIAICETGSTYPSANCVTTTMTFLQTETGFYMGNNVVAFGINVAQQQDTGNGVSTPTGAAPGSTFTATSAPAQAIIPATDSGFTVESVGQYSAISACPGGRER